MNKQVSKSGLAELAIFSEAERRALAVLNLLLVRGVITAEQRDEQLADATSAVLGEQLWVRIRAKANAHASNEKAKEIAEKKRAMLIEWLRDQLHHCRSGKLAAKLAEKDRIVPGWGYDKILREITAFRKTQQAKP
jgi:hypothetical protein